MKKKGLIAVQAISPKQQLPGYRIELVAGFGPSMGCPIMSPLTTISTRRPHAHGHRPCGLVKRRVKLQQLHAGIDEKDIASNSSAKITREKYGSIADLGRLCSMP